MYYQVASKLVLAGAPATMYTQAVSLSGANAVYCTIQTVGGTISSATMLAVTSCKASRPPGSIHRPADRCSAKFHR